MARRRRKERPDQLPPAHDLLSRPGSECDDRRDEADATDNQTGHRAPTVTPPPPDRHVTPSLVWLEPAWRAGIAIYRAPSTDTVTSQECFAGLTRSVGGRGLSLTPAVSGVTASGVRSSSALVRGKRSARLGVTNWRQQSPSNGACRLLRELRHVRHPRESSFR